VLLGVFNSETPGSSSQTPASASKPITAGDDGKAGPILVQTVAAMRRLDHVTDHTGKSARGFPDGK
jgi:hypothetical protein